MQSNCQNESSSSGAFFEVEKIISEHLSDEKTAFVFPTQTAAGMWADRATTLGRTAVAMERFIAWDDFKGTCIKSKNPQKSCIPSLMRQIFAEDLICKNAQNPFFKSIIVPDFAKESASFAKWISKMLPSLALWNEYNESFTKSGGELDDEDTDYSILYKKYKDFLDERNLFDPAWENPPFTGDGRTYFIFFPEILMDYAEYKRIFAGTDKIKIVSTKSLPSLSRATVHFYESSTVELRELFAALLSAHEEYGIKWSDMALSVPDLKTYAPYLEREFVIHQIPFTFRMGSKLGESRAGNFFVQAQECVQKGFPFALVKKILLNFSLPWKNEEKNRALVSFGRENNCLCSYEYKEKFHNPWRESLKKENPLYDFYENFEKKLSDLVNAKSFSEINAKYFIFRNEFFDMDKCSKESDQIISTCIRKLSELIQIENEFLIEGGKWSGQEPCRVPSPFSFFTSCLLDENYVPQKESEGVQIFAYRNSAESPFLCQFVLDASQDSLSLSSLYKQLSFLNDSKREKLGIEDVDPTEDFLRLYASCGKSYFSAAEKTFTGYSFPHGLLKSIRHIPEPEKEKNGEKPKEILSYDIFDAEKRVLLEKSEKEERYEMKAGGEKKYPTHFPEIALGGFSVWRARALPFDSEGFSFEQNQKLIRSALFDEERKRWKITQSALKNFFLCPRLWFFKNVLGVKNQDNEALLINRFTMGNVYHEILDRYCASLKENGILLSPDMNESVKKCTRSQLLNDALDSTLKRFHASRLSRALLSTARDSIYEKIESSVVKFSELFLNHEVAETEKSYSFEIEGKSWFLEGRIDCLLRNPADFSTTLVDYKSSATSVPKSVYEREGEVADPQMPMYKRLIEAQSGENEVSKGAFYNLKDCELKKVFGFEKNEPFEPTLDAFDKHCEEYVSRLESLDFSIDEKKQTFSVCTKKECEDYRGACRRFFNVSGR